MTEKDYNAKQRENKVMKKQENTNKKVEAPVTKENAKVKEEIKSETPEKKVESKVGSEKKVEATKKKEQIKKDKASAKGINLPLSTKDSVAVCRFIRGKPLDKAISDLEQVLNFKIAIPMKKGFPHRKGKGVMAGRYHTKTVEYFIRLLKSLKANSSASGIEEPVIIKAIPNRASMPYGRFGRVRRKRTHIQVEVIEKKLLKKSNKKIGEVS